MSGEKTDYSAIKETLKSLCCSNGWCYGIFWGFDQRDSLLLTLKDAYCEEQMAALIDNMILQVHVLGGGVIGQTSFLKTHRWKFADSHLGIQNSFGSVDVFQDDSDFYCQFSMGIKTIALITVEPWGIVQFGSTQTIPERTDFVDQVKQAFRGMAQSLKTLETSVIPPQPFASTLDTNSFFSSSPLIENQIQFDSKSATQLEQLFLESGNFFACSDSQALSNCNDISILTSYWPHMTSRPSENNVLSEPNSYESCMNRRSLDDSAVSSDSATLADEFKSAQRPTSLLSLEELFQENDFEKQLSKLCPMDGDDLSDLFSPQPGSSSTTSSLTTSLLGSAIGLTPVSNLNSGYKSPPIDVSEKLPANSMQSSVTDAFNMFNREDNKFSDASSIDKMMIFNSFGAKSKNHWDETLTLSENVTGKRVGSSNSLFSKLGLDQLLNGFAGNNSTSLAKSRLFEDQSSKRRKIDECSWAPHHQVKMQEGHPNIMELDCETSAKKRDSCIGGNSSISGGGNTSTTNSILKRQEEHVKIGKKKAKPGTRLRPKDRQMIQDRLAELRHLIPNGEKMSIDRLLERTIRHMNFMQSLTKHAKRLQQIDKPKIGTAPKDNFSNIGAGVTWACEVGEQTMVCPLVVEDLSTPGQMLIEILCEEQGFFLEIVDIIRGFGLIILKGVMEVREAKIWAHFIVETEGSRRVTRHEIFSSLIQLLQMTSTGEGAAANSSDHFGGKVISSPSPCLFDNCQPAVPIFPVNNNMADTLQYANL